MVKKKYIFLRSVNNEWMISLFLTPIQCLCSLPLRMDNAYFILVSRHKWALSSVGGFACVTGRDYVCSREGEALSGVDIRRNMVRKHWEGSIKGGRDKLTLMKLNKQTRCFFFFYQYTLKVGVKYISTADHKLLCWIFTENVVQLSVMSTF